MENLFHYFPVAIIPFDVCFGTPRAIFFVPLRFDRPSGFQVIACLVIKFGDFCKVCPVHLQHLFLISSPTGSWFGFSHSRLLSMVSGQRILSILRRQLFRNTMVVVVLQVPAPYSRTVLTFVLKILTLMSADSCFEFHMFFNCGNGALALPVLAFTSASDPLC
ncbi:unnamed protein product [Schistosoma curassoni]|uniref:Uncharacterized protein n=1 Tax=Schistosoma curassoni TaxID=6186 RepID=A0A3P8JTP2_9TREM|nr:unnamed protein product [Schistosoma curassoni]